MLINQNGRTNVRDVRIKQYSHDADTITIVVDRNRAGHDLSVLPLQLLIGAQDIMDVVAEGVDDALTKIVNKDSIEVTWRPQGRHTAGSDRIMCQIVFADCGNVVAYTDTFAVVIEKSLKQIKDCVYADGYTMLDQYLRRLEGIRDETQEIRDLIGDTAAGAGAAAKQAQEAASDAERFAGTASESAEDAASSAAQASESAKAVAADRQEAERLLSEAQTAAGVAESAQRGAELAASAASSAAGQAQEATRDAAGSASAAAGSAREAQTSAAEAAESAKSAAAAKQEVIKARQDAVEGIQSAKDAAIKDVQDAAVEITADREQIARNKAGIAALTESLEAVQNGKAGAIVDKASGTSILLQGSDEAGLDGLIIYGGSTQGSTTGVNLLPFEVGQKGQWFEVFEDGVKINSDANRDIYAIGGDDLSSESNYSEFTLLSPGEYYLYCNRPNINLYVVAWRNGTNLTLGNSSAGKSVKITVNDGDKFRIFLRTDSQFFGNVLAIISRAPLDASGYEPYTGGKPSPSPEYPQEIESVGMGEIGVDVLGKNLIPFPYPLIGGAGTQVEKAGVKYTVQSDGGGFGSWERQHLFLA